MADLLTADPGLLRKYPEVIKGKFRRMDTNSDGALDFRELKDLLRRGSPDISDDDMELLFNHIDADSNGRVNFDEFVDYVCHRDEPVETVADDQAHNAHILDADPEMAAKYPELIKSHFRKLDVDHDGTLDLDELTTLMRSKSATISDRQVELLFRKCDKDGSGRIDFAEFVDLVCRAT
mmetsp:Transcript_74229/g.206291  ORF Transcript_74229/g.206291 Transcript_74229/m.206291 type:complete len:179 (+) Transcript_74229:144-680(+)